MDEFELIRRFFARPALTCAGMALDLGPGDDAALLSLPSAPENGDGWQLVQSLDTAVADLHFPASGDPFLIGWRTLALSASDLAAMGARPHSFLLGLTLPEADPAWLEPFSEGLAALAQQLGLSLAGGDITRGPLAVISIQVQGLVEKGRALTRSGARPGDRIYVGGSLGDARAALPFVLGQQAGSGAAARQLQERYWQPVPQLELGRWLVEQGVTTAMDLSDGLAGDLPHILRASGCGAELDSQALPISSALKQTAGDRATAMALAGGDDCVLCFCWPSSLPEPTASPVPLTCIGTVTDHAMLLVDGKPSEIAGFRHF